MRRRRTEAEATAEAETAGMEQFIKRARPSGRIGEPAGMPSSTASAPQCPLRARRPSALKPHLRRHRARRQKRRTPSRSIASVEPTMSATRRITALDLSIGLRRRPREMTDW